MQFQLPQVYFSKIMRAIVEFDMIQEGDRILIGLSGGKDSLLLSYALAMMRERLKKRFSLCAFTLDLMFDRHFDTDALERFCQRLRIPYHSQATDIAAIIRENPNRSACFTCAFFRRGAINRMAKNLQCNKIAYAHHNDDAVETLLMGLFHSGQISTFLPKTYLSRTGLTVIRPLIYLREDEIRQAEQYHGMTPIASPCPYNGKTARQAVKELIRRLSRENPLLYPHLAAALRENNVGELWPAAKQRAEMADVYRQYMKKPS